MSIKTFNEFLNETDAVGDDAVMATKPTALSESWCQKIQECIDHGMKEAIEWHNDEHPEHTAEQWATEGKNFINECIESMARECADMTNSKDTHNKQTVKVNTKVQQ